MATGAQVQVLNSQVWQAQWPSLDNGENGDWVLSGRYPDLTVTVSGNSSTTAVALVGSEDKVNTFPLKKVDLAALSFSGGSNGGEQVLENPLYIRPEATGGSATGIKVTLQGRKI